jgi:uncharacterized protein YecT (DUF1311 family)
MEQKSNNDASHGLDRRRSGTLKGWGMTTLIWALGGTVSLMAAAWAGAAGATSPAFDKCLDASGGVTIEMHNCEAAENERLDLELNSIYKQVMGRLDANAREHLRLQERAWLKKRDHDCNQDIDTGGSIAPIEIDGCYIEFTDKRITVLKALANGHP